MLTGISSLPLIHGAWLLALVGLYAIVVAVHVVATLPFVRNAPLVRERAPRLADGRLLESTVVVGLAACVVLFALGSSSVPSWKAFGHDARWVSLVALTVLAWLLAFRAEASPRWLRPTGWMPYVGLSALGLIWVSAAWSVDPRLTLERAASVTLLVVAAAGVALASLGIPTLADRSLLGLAYGGLLVCLGGLVVVALYTSDAYQPAPFRYRGLGENPNTVALLAGVLTPLVGILLTDSDRRRRRIGGGVLAVFYLTILFSGSRGGLVAAFAGSIVFVVAVLPDWRKRRAVLVAATLAFVFAGLAGHVLSTAAARAATPAQTNPQPSANLGRLEDEIGRPHGVTNVPLSHSLFGSSGRLQAWVGAVEETEDRPVVGYGFGTEDEVFVDRFYSFEGGRPENSFVGMFMQLGIVGVVLLVALLVGLGRVTVRTIRAAPVRLRRYPAACASTLVAGLVLAFVQSYIYSVGNLATVSLWVCAFLLAFAGASAARVTEPQGAATGVADVG